MDHNKVTFEDLCEQFKTLDTRLTALTIALQEANTKSQEANDRSHQAEKRIKCLEEKLQVSENVNIKLSKDLSQLCEKVIRIEAHSMRDNLVFDGISESSPEYCLGKVKLIMKQKMGIDDADTIQIVRCHRLGERHSNPGPHSRPRPIIIKYHYYPEFGVKDQN